MLVMQHCLAIKPASSPVVSLHTLNIKYSKKVRFYDYRK